MSLETLLGDINSGIGRGGLWTPCHERDNLEGLGYISTFNKNELGRSGNEVLNVFNDGNHYDVIEKNPFGNVLHHRIYDPLQQ